MRREANFLPLVALLACSAVLTGTSTFAAEDEAAPGDEPLTLLYTFEPDGTVTVRLVELGTVPQAGTISSSASSSTR